LAEGFTRDLDERGIDIDELGSIQVYDYQALMNECRQQLQGGGF
jgi:hypothetical protein